MPDDTISFCSQCKDYRTVFDELETWGVFTIPETVRGYEWEGEESCDNCGNVVQPGTYIIEDFDSFVSSVGGLFAELISNDEIGECQHCNETVIPFTQKYCDPMDLQTVYELVEGYGFPSDVSDEIYSSIQCSGCGSELAQDDPYITRHEADSWYDEEIELVLQTFKNVTESEGNAFIKYLLKNPMLGLNHPVGKLIYSQIKEGTIPNNTQLEAGTVYYRGRKRRNLERLAPFIPEELWNPPEGIPSQGRYNPPGISSLYLGSSIDVILAELHFNPDGSEAIDIAEFLILEDMRVWDTRDLDIELFNSIPSFNKGLVLSQEYIFPNFIAQCLMASGYNGIIYRSTKGDGFNICLFNFNREKELVVTNVIPYDSFKHRLTKPIKKLG